MFNVLKNNMNNPYDYNNNNNINMNCHQIIENDNCITNNQEKTLLEKKKYRKKTKLTAMEYIKECFKYAFFANIIGVFAETFCRIFGKANCNDTTGYLLQAINSMNTLFAILAVCLATIAIGKPLFEKMLDNYLNT